MESFFAGIYHPYPEGEKSIKKVFMTKNDI